MLGGPVERDGRGPASRMGWSVRAPSRMRVVETKADLGRGGAGGRDGGGR